MDLPSVNVKGDIVESLNTGEGLADVIQGKTGAGVRSLQAFPRLNHRSL
jgi:hypothetical protein